MQQMRETLTRQGAWQVLQVQHVRAPLARLPRQEGGPPGQAEVLALRISRTAPCIHQSLPQHPTCFRGDVDSLTPEPAPRLFPALCQALGERFAVHRFYPARLVPLGLLPVAPNPAP